MLASTQTWPRWSRERESTGQGKARVGEEVVEKRGGGEERGGGLHVHVC